MDDALVQRGLGRVSTGRGTPRHDGDRLHRRGALDRDRRSRRLRARPPRLPREEGGAAALPAYPCGEGRLAVGRVRMRDAGLELELAITQDRCLTRLPRYWGAWNGGAGSVSSRRLRCWRRQRRRERICRRSRAGTGYCRPKYTSGAAWLSLGLLACRAP